MDQRSPNYFIKYPLLVTQQLCNNQERRETWIINYTGTQSFINTLSQSFAYKVLVLSIDLDWLIQTSRIQTFYLISTFKLQEEFFFVIIKSSYTLKLRYLIIKSCYFDPQSDDYRFFA